MVNCEYVIIDKCGHVHKFDHNGNEIDKQPQNKQEKYTFPPGRTFCISPNAHICIDEYGHVTVNVNNEDNSKIS